MHRSVSVFRKTVTKFCEFKGNPVEISFTLTCLPEIPFCDVSNTRLCEILRYHSAFWSVCLGFCFFVFFFCFLFPILQYDFMERLDGKEKWSVVESPRERRSIQTLVQNEAVFVQYLDVGLWHLAFYNDGKDKEVVSFSTVILGRYFQKLSISSLY